MEGTILRFTNKKHARRPNMATLMEPIVPVTVIAAYADRSKWDDVLRLLNQHKVPLESCENLLIRTARKGFVTEVGRKGFCPIIHAHHAPPLLVVWHPQVVRYMKNVQGREEQKKGDMRSIVKLCEQEIGFDWTVQMFAATVAGLCGLVLMWLYFSATHMNSGTGSNLWIACSVMASIACQCFWRSRKHVRNLDALKLDVAELIVQVVEL